MVHDEWGHVDDQSDAGGGGPEPPVDMLKTCTALAGLLAVLVLASYLVVDFPDPSSVVQRLVPRMLDGGSLR
jgi:hypothetical protein